MYVCIIAHFVSIALPAAAPGSWEKLDRGLVAIPSQSGTYLGWRLLAGDPPDVAFHVYRVTGDQGAPTRLTSQPLQDATDFTDASGDTSASYFVRAVVNGQEQSPSPRATVRRGAVPSCVSIKLQGDYAPQKVALADLDGDGALDYVIKQPNFNTDPFQSPGYWKKSTDTYKLEAYRSDGTFMWRYDMGWSIEEGIWYSPYIAFDVDGDGKAEVYAKAGEGDPRDADGRVTGGPEFLVQIDGMTGKIIRRAPWPDRSGYEDYNWWSRNLLGIAFLDGKRPSVIVERGTYSQIKVEAFNQRLEPLWKWNSKSERQRYNGSGMHGMHAADVDGDGRDEIVLGSAVLDDTGRGLWTNPMHHKAMAHPDVCYVADIDPARPGLEIFYGFETPQPREGVCLVEAGTGKIIWGFDGRTNHVHNQGMVADISADHPGLECYCAEKDRTQFWLYAASGERIGATEIDGLSPPAVWWDGDPCKELIIRGNIQPWRGKDILPVVGKVIAIADCLGDWREEVLASLPGELRIYTTVLPSRFRHTCLMQDRLYRNDVALVSMGYFYPPQLSANLPGRTSPGAPGRAGISP